MKNEIAETILSQLGGGRFLAMTGAHLLVAYPEGLQFKLPRLGYCSITLTGEDLYNLRFFVVRGTSVIERAHICGLYAEQLAPAFTDHTGLRVSL